MSRKESIRRLTAVCFADIVGYTELSTRDERAALRLVDALQSAAASAADARGGRVVKYLGDAALLEFASAEAAVSAALEVRERFRNGAEDFGYAHDLRIGVHLGETTIAPDGDVYGDVVNVAARVQAAAEPGELLVTADVHKQVRRFPGFTFGRAREHGLKGVEGPVVTYRVGRRYEPEPEQEAGTADADLSERRRLLVLPFKLLRPDPETEFLSFGLADAVACSLMGLRSLLVRSPASALRYAQGADDPAAIARAADADLVLAGTILAAADKVRVTAQLLEGESATLLWSETATVAIGDLFELQDDLAGRIVASLSAPLGESDRVSFRHDVSTSGTAYELFLRANHLSIQYGDWLEAATLYERAAEEDPDFAPIWARLGRCYRLLGKYSGDASAIDAYFGKAEACFERSLALNPHLALAHSLMAQFEVESGRCIEGMLRLLGRVRSSGPAVELYVGLVHTCRYCGLDEASFAAHRLATELDASVVTSVPFTYLARGEYERVLEVATPGDFSAPHALLHLDRAAEAVAALDEIVAGSPPSALLRFTDALRAIANDEIGEAVRLVDEIFETFPDPEGVYLMATHLLRRGRGAEGLHFLERSVRDGYHPTAGLRVNPALDAVRDDPGFGAVLEIAEDARAAAQSALRRAGGDRLLENLPRLGERDAAAFASDIDDARRSLGATPSQTSWKS